MSADHEVIDVEIVGDSSQATSSNDDITSNPCKLCFDEIKPGKKFTLESCGCFFCKDCMRSYIEVLISDGVALTIACPDAECVVQGRLQVDEVSSLIHGETLDKYLRLRAEQEVAVNPHRSFCPNPNCSFICHVPAAQRPSKLKKLKKIGKKKTTAPVKVSCFRCEMEFCHICKVEWSDKHKCDVVEFATGNNALVSKNEARLANSRTDAAIKRCPVCNILIEKDRGCGQMICKNCSHVFCWHCLKLLDNDFMLRHYDKGPCKNFLGHSRSQVLRHRLGVIGLFAAFCLLILAVSPILILAAPVFLCFKWKECCEKAWHRAQVENGNALFTELEMTAQPHVTVTETVVETGSSQGSQTSTSAILPLQASTSSMELLSSPPVFVESHRPPSDTSGLDPSEAV